MIKLNNITIIILFLVALFILGIFLYITRKKEYESFANDELIAWQESVKWGAKSQADCGDKMDSSYIPLGYLGDNKGMCVPRCQSDDDCPDLISLVKGNLGKIKCNNLNNELNILGYCTAFPLKPNPIQPKIVNGCGDDAMCNKGLRCDKWNNAQEFNGNCVEDERIKCASNADCDEGNECFNHPGLQNSFCALTCENDNDCNSNEKCLGSDPQKFLKGVCLEPNKAFSKTKPLPKCGEDSHCFNGYGCENGSCVLVDPDS